jgi:ribosomal protein S2
MQLIVAGAHLGHSIKNLLFLATWLVYGCYGNLCLIDLRKTLYAFRLGFRILQRVVFLKQPVWFVNLDQTKEDYVRFGASLAGEFFCSKF